MLDLSREAYHEAVGSVFFRTTPIKAAYSTGYHKNGGFQQFQSGPLRAAYMMPGSVNQKSEVALHGTGLFSGIVPQNMDAELSENERSLIYEYCVVLPVIAKSVALTKAKRGLFGSGTPARRETSYRAAKLSEVVPGSEDSQAFVVRYQAGRLSTVGAANNGSLRFGAASSLYRDQAGRSGNELVAQYVVDETTAESFISELRQNPETARTRGLDTLQRFIDIPANQAQERPPYEAWDARSRDDGGHSLLGLTVQLDLGTELVNELLVIGA